MRGWWRCTGRWGSGNTDVMGMCSVTWSVYSGGSGVDRHHLILSYIKYTLYLSLFWSHWLLLRLGWSTQSHGSSQPGRIISSHPHVRHLQPELLFVMNSILISWEVWLSVDDNQLAFYLRCFTALGLPTSSPMQLTRFLDMIRTNPTFSALQPDWSGPISTSLAPCPCLGYFFTVLVV